MIASIYDTPADWVNSKYYDRNDIVKNNNLYYYALFNQTSHPSNPFSAEKGNNWGGITSFYGKTKPIFLWKPSFGLDIKHKPRIKKTQYGDGFQQISADGINNDLLTITLKFENRDYNEFAAISHFLKVRNAVESFIFTPPNPENKTTIFRCEEWDGNFVFVGNNTITAIFEEVLV